MSIPHSRSRAASGTAATGAVRPISTAVEKTQIADSDIITFHAYGWPEAFFERVRELEAYGRPLVCTEYMARGAGSTFDGVLPVGKRMNVGMINWGFVNGRTQTNLPWDSWQRPYVLTQPTVWFHDILHADGTPYREHEVELLRALSAAPKGVVPDILDLGGPVAVYTPDLAKHPREDASYPRVIRLEHAGAANGTLLATFFRGGAGQASEFPIYSSTDDGWSWSGPIGVVRDSAHRPGSRCADSVRVAAPRGRPAGGRAARSGHGVEARRFHAPGHGGLRQLGRRP